MYHDRLPTHTPSTSLFDSNSSMSDDESTPPPSRRSHSDAVHECSADGFDIELLHRLSFPSASSWIEDFKRDDNSEIYSYTSTWSTNYTMSNLVGPGRLLGKLYSRAGSSLERHLGKLAYRAGVGSHAKAEKALPAAYDMILSKEVGRRKTACNILLQYARLNGTTIQVMAFKKIVEYSLLFPSLIRSSFENFCRNRNEAIDFIIFSWKRPGVEYNPSWLYHYKLVSRCLSTHARSVMDTAQAFDDIQLNSLDFSEFGTVLLCCKDTVDLLIALRFIYRYWNGRGLKTYVDRNGTKDSVLLRFATALVVRCEAHFFWSVQSVDHHICRSAEHLMFDLWDCLRGLDPDRLEELLADTSALAIWVEMFKFHCISRSFEGDLWLQKRYPLGVKTWKELCREQLPNPEHAKFLQRLSRLGDILGDATFKRYRPGRQFDDGEKWSIFICLRDAAVSSLV